MNIASYARPNYQYLPSFLYFTQKIANAAIIGKMRILWSRNVRNNTCCKYFRATISNDSCCCEMLIIIPPRYLLSDWTKVSIDNKTIYKRYLLTERSSLVPPEGTLTIQVLYIKGLLPYYIISYNKQESFQMITKKNSKVPRVVRKDYGSWKIQNMQESTSMLSSVANLSFQSGAFWL